SYFPPPVRTVLIPKPGGTRSLGIPTVADRIAQMTVKLYLEPVLEPVFDVDSYGYRPGKSALDALNATRSRCWQFDWVLDLDIKGFFDNIDHDLMMKAVCFHTDCKWIQLYIERWLKAPAQMQDGKQVERSLGTPQGGVISPLLANLFLHYAFDAWMRRTYPGVPFERYADDIVVHCKSEKEALSIHRNLKERMTACKLEFHPEKTKIAYCKDANRRGNYDTVSFDFLGYTFRPRLSKNRWGKYFVNFSPAISRKAVVRIFGVIRDWQFNSRVPMDLEALARLANPAIRGWINYYGRFCPSAMHSLMMHLNQKLAKWAMRKYKRFRFHEKRATHWLGRIANREPGMFVHWECGYKPSTGQ
ncbi:MAG: group II intron reverse transcriptase/maturase, partial [Desulfamplus sp.]|nr:group II intron reverse transcriptase/maturase [Desulfamplus sp.]